MDEEDVVLKSETDVKESKVKKKEFMAKKNLDVVKPIPEVVKEKKPTVVKKPEVVKKPSCCESVAISTQNDEDGSCHFFRGWSRYGRLHCAHGECQEGLGLPGGRRGQGELADGQAGRA